MRTSILLLGALSGMAMATENAVLVGTNTIYQTTTITVHHCEPTHTDCVGGSVTILTTAVTTECLTSTPPPVISYPATLPPVVDTPAPAPAPAPSSEVPSSSAIYVPSTTAEVPGTTAVAPSSTPEVPSATPEVPATTDIAPSSSVEVPTATPEAPGPSAVTTSSAEGAFSSVPTAEVPSTLTTVSPEIPSYVPVGPPAYSNTSEPLLTASGTPTTTTAVVITTPATNYSPSAPSASTTQTGASGAGSVVVPGFTLVFLALGAYIFG